MNKRLDEILLFIIWAYAFICFVSIVGPDGDNSLELIARDLTFPRCTYGIEPFNDNPLFCESSGYQFIVLFLLIAIRYIFFNKTLDE